jgi:hypothetical protein
MELNKILGSEGLGMHYNHQGSQNASKPTGLFGLGGGKKGKGDVCKTWLNSSSHLTKCWSSKGGSCYCKNQFLIGRSCKCARMTIAALRKTCQQIPAGCDYGSWVGALASEYGSASAWLNSWSFPSTFFGNLPFLNQGFSGEKKKSELFCSGSPLVLDLADDGVQPTSPAGGVSFDLMGQGAVRTAWVSGDDALLALDRNGNGVIDDGAELFGDATTVGGDLADDGFSALAALDRPAMGGNENGLVDDQDLMFGSLRLWADANKNGRSEAGELRSLSEAGVAAIEVAGREESQVNDHHGNDLSLRGAFLRTDGRRGLVVDVVFRLGQ